RIWRAAMKRKSKILTATMVGLLGGVVASPVWAVEVITRDDIVNNVVTKDQLVKVADNAVLLLDTSSWSNDQFANTGQPIIQAMKNELKARNSYLPDLGYNMGIYTYTGWNEIYPMQPYNRDKVAAALDTLPAKGSGPTPLRVGLEKLEKVLKPLHGRTAVFVFWDGYYTGPKPPEPAKRLA